MDSDVAKKFQLGPSKVEYLANFDIKPYLKNLLVESIKKLDCYCFLWWKFKKVTQSCEMDLLLRYFD